jgi:hypothetical protein
MAVDLTGSLLACPVHPARPARPARLARLAQLARRKHPAHRPGRTPADSLRLYSPPTKPLPCLTSPVLSSRSSSTPPDCPTARPHPTRTKCAATAWAAEKLRSAGEFHALPDGVKDRMLNTFEVPAAWRPDAQHQALLQACHSSSWALNPSLSHGLVNRERSELFRLGGQFAVEPRCSGTTPIQLLSPQEYSKLLFPLHRPATRSRTSCSARAV